GSQGVDVRHGGWWPPVVAGGRRRMQASDLTPAHPPRTRRADTWHGHDGVRRDRSLRTTVPAIAARPATAAAAWRRHRHVPIMCRPALAGAIHGYHHTP